MKNVVLCMFLVLLTHVVAVGADQDSRFVRKIQFPGAREFVVVAEGDFEPRSIGSYSVRIYSGVNPEFPIDDYAAGIIRQRDGTVEDVKFYDVDSDSAQELIVIMRSVGSGGYLSADAFDYGNKSLKLLLSVSGLEAKADPILALIKKLKKGL